MAYRHGNAPQHNVFPEGCHSHGGCVKLLRRLLPLVVMIIAIDLMLAVQQLTTASGSNGASSRALVAAALAAPSSKGKGKGKQGTCNLNKGWWEQNFKYWPIYNGSSCSLLRHEFNCQENGRTDLRFMQWVWKSPGCNINLFNPKKFMEKLRNKVFMHAGDSLGSNLESAIQCMVSSKYTVERFKGRVGPNGPYVVGWRVPAVNATFVHADSVYLVAAEQQSGSYFGGTWKVHVNEADNAWTDPLLFTDYVLFSAGHWYMDSSSRSWYSGDSQLSISAKDAFTMAMKTVRDTVIGKKYQGMPMILTFTANHYQDAFTNHQTCAGVNDPLNASQWAYAAQNTNAMSERSAQMQVFRRYPQFKYVDVTMASLARPDAHVQWYGQETTNEDCTHYCAPGVPDVWAHIVYSLVMGYIKHTNQT